MRWRKSFGDVGDVVILVMRRCGDVVFFVCSFIVVALVSHVAF